jgi:hypothetical protein
LRKPRLTSYVYAFYKPNPVATHGRPGLVFECAKEGCTKIINRFDDTGDKRSTGNLGRHASDCWGHLAVERAKQLGKADDARELVVKPLIKYGTLTAAFEAQGDKQRYSALPHTHAEIRYDT